MVDSGLPAETPAPVTPSVKPKTTQSKNKQDSTHPSPTTGSHGSKDDAGDVASAVRGTQLEAADGMPAPVATKTVANGQSGPWDGVAAIVSMFLPKSSRPSNTAEGHDLSPDDPASHADHGVVVVTAGSGTHTAVTSQGSIVLDGSPLVDGQATVISGQTISAKSGTVFVNGVPQNHYALSPSAAQSPSAMTAQEHAGEYQADDAGQADGQSANSGMVSAVDGSISAVAEGTNDDIPEDSPYQDKPDAVFAVNGHIYGVENKSGTPYINGAPASVGDTVTFNGDVLTIGSHEISFQGTTIALPDGRPEATTATAGADIIVAQEKMTALKVGADVLIAGTKLTLGQVTTIAGTRVSAASNGVVVGSSTAVFHKMNGAAANAGTAITIDGTVYYASSMAGQPHIAFLAGQTLQEGGAAVTIDGQVITNGANGVSLVKPTASATVASTTHSPESLLVIDGTTYTATPVSGKSGVVVLQGQTLSVGGPAVIAAGHLITEGSNGISVVKSTSKSSDATSGSPRSTEISGSSATTDTESTPSEESSASVRSYGSGKNALSFVVLFVILISLRGGAEGVFHMVTLIGIVWINAQMGFFSRPFEKNKCVR